MIKQAFKYFRDVAVRKRGSDPFLIKLDYNKDIFKYKNISLLKTGRISAIYGEPVFSHTYIEVTYFSGGPSSLVKWPGPNVETTTSGSRGKGEVPHGSYFPPKENQRVLIGFEDGVYSNPVVVNAYPYETNNDGINDTAHVNPLTSMGFSSEDVIVGHFIGSYFVIRGTTPTIIKGETPIPGDIEAYTNSSIRFLSEDVNLGKNPTREQAVLGTQAINLLTTIVDNINSVIDKTNTVIDQLTAAGNIVTGVGPAQFNPANVTILTTTKTELTSIKTTLNNLKNPSSPLGTNTPVLSTQVNISA